MKSKYYRYKVNIENVGVEYHCFDNEGELDKYLTKKYPGISYEIIDTEERNY